MPDWKLSERTPVEPKWPLWPMWTFQGDRDLDLQILPCYPNYRPSIMLLLSCTYSPEDLQYLDPNIARHTVRLSDGNYWATLLKGYAPDEFEAQVKERFPLMSLPDNYRKTWEAMASILGQ